MTSEERRRAKTANFGIIYGISAFGLSQRLEIPRKEAKDIIDGYFESYPKVKEYMDDVVAKAKEEDSSRRSSAAAAISTTSPRTTPWRVAWPSAMP